MWVKIDPAKIPYKKLCCRLRPVCIQRAVKARRDGDTIFYYCAEHAAETDAHQIAKAKFIILQGLAEHNRFWSDWTPGEDAERFACQCNGEVAYRILGWTNTVAEAQTFLYGRSY